jgi:hypothetical protein
MAEKKNIFDCKFSTSTSPIAFFTSFFVNDKILVAKQFFIDRIPDLKNPLDETARRVSYISLEKLEFHIEHSILDYDPETHNGHYENFTQEVSFSKYLENILKDEFYESKELLTSKLSSGEFMIKKSRIELVSNIIVEKILPTITKIESDENYFNCVDVCKRPLEAIIKFLYRDYPDYTPDQFVDERIGKIFLNSDSSKDLLEKSKLDLAVIDVLSGLYSDIPLRIFSFHDDQNDIAQFKKLLLHSEGYDDIKPIKIYGAVGSVNFALAMILGYLKKSRRSLARTKKVLINGIPFVPSTCDTEFYRFPLSNPKEAATIQAVIKNKLS